MTINQLEKELKENKLSSIYLLYGQERYLLDNVVKKIKKSTKIHYPFPKFPHTECIQKK